MSELVSIVIASYNAAHFLGNTIDSVIDQTYKDWELIIVNDASTDNTIELVNDYIDKDDRIRIFSLETNNGNPSYPRNFGVKMARGEWIAILDSDDIWHPRKLEFQMAFLKRTNAQFCSTQMKNFKKEREISFNDPDDLKHVVITFSNQLKRYNTPTSSIVLKKHLLEKFPFMNDKLHEKREDLKCWLDIHQEIGESIKLQYPFVRYRISPGQLSKEKFKLVFRSF
ncbi:MAG: glycosyltransferase, partial [Bacteroidia bacterium]|nr:glycosyltransferase [Bacteroidia bacterium]